MGSRAAGYVLFFVGLSLLLSLGGWQWRRGVDKSVLETLLENSPGHYITIDRAPPNWSALAYRQVRLQGRWLTTRAFLMDNRTHLGRQGYEVFTPFQLAADRAILLVNRGWVEGRRTDAGAEIYTANVDLSPGGVPVGRLYLPGKGFTLGPALSEPASDSDWPKVMQYFDTAALSAALGRELAPAALALDAGQPGAFTQRWRAAAMPASRHFGYAVQWWSLAIVLAVFGVIWRRRSHNSHSGGGDSQ